MEHRKDKHYENIAECIENKNGSCRFYSDCWYKHTEVMSKDENLREVNGMNTPELIYRLFKMMENRNSNVSLLQKVSIRK